MPRGWCSPSLGVGALLCLGYGAKYFTMAPAFAMRTLIRDSVEISTAHWDNTIAVGYLVYALCKLYVGPVVDRIGGRIIFVGCLYSLSVVAALQSLVSNRWAFSACNLTLTLFGAPVWIALAKVASAWTPPGRSGMMMGVLSLSYMVDDVAVRWTVAGLLGANWEWNNAMIACAALAAALTTPSLLCLKPAPGATAPITAPMAAVGIVGARCRRVICKCIGCSDASGVAHVRYARVVLDPAADSAPASLRAPATVRPVELVGIDQLEITDLNGPTAIPPYDNGDNAPEEDEADGAYDGYGQVGRYISGHGNWGGEGVCAGGTTRDGEEAVPSHGWHRGAIQSTTSGTTAPSPVAQKVPSSPLPPPTHIVGREVAQTPAGKTRCQLLSNKPFVATLGFYGVVYMCREFLSNYSVPFLALQWCASSLPLSASSSSSNTSLSSRMGASSALSNYTMAAGTLPDPLSDPLPDPLRDPATSAQMLDCMGGNDAASHAAMGSVVFSVVGAGSSLFCGWAKDRLSTRGCITLCGVFVAVSSIAALISSAAGASLGYGGAITLLAIQGMGLLGPYSLCGGAFVIDFGGLESTGTACSLMDGTGAICAFLIMAIKGSLIGGGTSGMWTGWWLLSALNVLAALVCMVLWKVTPPAKG